MKPPDKFGCIRGPVPLPTREHNLVRTNIREQLHISQCKFTEMHIFPNASTHQNTRMLSHRSYHYANPHACMHATKAPNFAHKEKPSPTLDLPEARTPKRPHAPSAPSIVKRSATIITNAERPIAPQPHRPSSEVSCAPSPTTNPVSSKRPLV